MSRAEPAELAAEVVRRALRRGAGQAECTLIENDEFLARVRLGVVETLKESGSSGAGLRVLRGCRAGSAYTSDLSDEGLDRMIGSALDLAGIAGEDPHAGLPDPAELGALEGDLGTYCEDVTALETSAKIERARRAEEAAFAVDPRIRNSEGASFGSRLSRRAFANSLGFAGCYRTSGCWLSVVPVAEQDGSKERDYWHTAARGAGGLEAPELVGRLAAGRALRRLGARKVPTAKVPVVFEWRAARSLVEHLFEAVDGGNVYRGASCLAGKLGSQVASPALTLIDDGGMAGRLGTSPFDDEGVRSRRTVVIERGVLSSFLMNTYAARKLGRATTGNASRGLSGNARVGHGNLYIEPGAAPAAQIVAGVKQGLLVTELLGSGVNIVTGDYSRGAAGLWIENGEIAYPVSEVTIAGNLMEIWKDVEVVGADLEFRAAAASPTLLIREMTVSGQ